MDEDGELCPHCGEYKDESHFDDDSLVCRECVGIAAAERQFRGDPTLDALEQALEADDEEGGDA